MKIVSILVLFVAVVCGTVAINNTIVLRDSLDQLDYIKSCISPGNDSKGANTNIQNYVIKDGKNDELILLRQELTNLRLQITDMKEKIASSSLPIKSVENNNNNLNDNNMHDKAAVLVNSNKMLDKLNADLTNIHQVRKSITKEEYLSACTQKIAEILGLADKKDLHEIIVSYTNKFEGLDNEDYNFREGYMQKSKLIQERYRDNFSSPDCQKEYKTLSDWYMSQDKQINDKKKELKEQMLTSLRPLLSEDNIVHKIFTERIKSNTYLSFFGFNSTWPRR